MKEEIKEGDYVINTEDKRAKPMKVERHENGTLGINLTGWFDWLPLGSRHKKVTK